ncbi:NAD(+) synthase [Natranaerobius trueperi]|uniref:NH(3)-dependent NAD(+) synthetase n=2 Tax=Natranaerobius trueperi TaxID=759412 RepID=A0A226BYQ9_9FIRM|nr:NAD(+) synthase [Natranaerobius trueperi]
MASKWIKTKVEEAGCKGTVVGLSGGIDSAVVAALSKKVFPNDTLGLVMPCHSEPQDAEDAYTLAKQLDINYKEVNLTSTFDEMYYQLTDQKIASDMALANIKPRLRMTVQYYYAQTFRYLVLGTSNKSELLIGYFTKYGDGAADLSPIANFTKMDIYRLAEYLNIPQCIIDRPPTAGIISGQTDQDELGFTYEDIEKYFMGEDLPVDIVNKIQKLEKASKHKKTLPPVFDLDNR